MRRNHYVLLAVFLFLQIFPYLAAQTHYGSEWVFGGFLLNPLDGNSYLAKMQLGWAGDWQFQLLYSPEKGAGAFLFLFYILLGHIARISGMAILFVFHAARVLAGLFLLLSIRRFCKLVFSGDEIGADWALWLTVLGSGAGWIVALSGGEMTGDFWVAETYPFLSGFANPHFPLGLAILLWMLIWEIETQWKGRRAVQAAAGTALAVIQPFGVVLLAGLFVGITAFRLWQDRKIKRVWDLWVVVPGGLLLLYQFWAIRSDALLVQWDRQNLTPALAGWDLVISLLPGLAFALVGVGIHKKQATTAQLTLIYWLAMAGVLICLPFNLQRRFMTGLFVPVSLLAVVGARWLAQKTSWAKRWLFPTILGLSVITNVLIFLTASLAAGSQVDDRPDARIFLSGEQLRALVWLRDHTPREAVVLANPQLGLYVPAWSGRHVIYGHPFESIQAESRKTRLEDGFAGRLSTSEFSQLLSGFSVNYVLIDGEYDTQILPTAAGKRVYWDGKVEVIQIDP